MTLGPPVVSPLIRKVPFASVMNGAKIRSVWDGFLPRMPMGASDFAVKRCKRRLQPLSAGNRAKAGAFAYVFIRLAKIEYHPLSIRVSHQNLDSSPGFFIELDLRS